MSYVEGGALQQTGLPILVDAGGGYLAVFTRRKDHASAGLIHTVQFSADLSLWTSSDTTPSRRTSDTAPGDCEAVSVPFPTTVPVTGGGAEKLPRFFRVSTTGA